MSKFKVGEVAIAVENETQVRSECEIMSSVYEGTYRISVKGHLSPSIDGFWTILESQLRKKKPPADKSYPFLKEPLSSWDKVEKDIGWSPVKEIEHG